MALSVSTAGLFVFLLPGLFLRTFIYQDSLVKRAVFSANGLYAALSVIGLALCVHAAALGGLGLLTALTGSDGLFLDLGQDTVLRLKGEVQWIPQGQSEVPVYERFYLGGRSLRGFQFRTVSPKGFRNDTGDPTDQQIASPIAEGSAR